MSKKQFIKRYSLIITRLRRSNASWEEIQKFLAQQSELDEEEYTMSIRTFQRDLQEILSLYQIEISYDRSQNKYEITQDDNDNRNERLMESFEIFSALNMSQNLKNQLIVEKRKPLGTENMNGLLGGIKNHFKVQFKYEKYMDNTAKKNDRTVFPLALQEARNRWYLVAKDSSDGLVKTFGLDRISELEISKSTFDYPVSFNLNEHFKNAFGIISSEKAPQKVVLEFSTEQANYIKSLPLHHSQIVVSEYTNTTLIELYLCPTYDFVMELLSMGKEVKVLEPKSLQDEIIVKLKETLNNYN